ncbi:MAG TPA: VWA domain-containing protein [Urbifossiella sp.]|jgi:hypothetical protein
MLPVFSTPLLFLGLLSLPALAAIYYLHTRSRLHPVSSLLLWGDARVLPDGGRRVDRLRLPLLFWLELLILVLLVLAAAGPHLPALTGARPLIVVLDDSFSMQAEHPNSPRKRAVEALGDELRNRPRESVRFILAGERPQLLGETSHLNQITPLLEGWSCQSPAARLDSATALALELGGESAAVLVLTDHPPDPPPTAGRVQWWSFGSAQPNWAFVNAGRTAGPHGDRLLLEVANLATEPRATTLRIDAIQPALELKRTELHLNAGEIHRMVLEIPDAVGVVRAVLDEDKLPFDNSVTLISPSRQSVTYELRIADQSLRSAFEKALRASGAATPAIHRPHLVFLDGGAEVPEQEEAWIVRVLNEADAEAFTGPFVIDRAHPLTDGLSLSGVVWGGGKSQLPGSPVVMAGNVILLSDAESAGGRHEIRLRLRPALSSLSQSPAWPELIWNLAHWRAAHLPGLDRTNIRIGEEAIWSLNSFTGTIEVIRPDGEVKAVPVHSRRAAIRAEQSGIYSLRAGDDKAAFAANVLNRDESDLMACVTGRWGDELDEQTLRRDYRDASEWIVLLALGVMIVHLIYSSKRSAAGVHS